MILLTDGSVDPRSGIGFGAYLCFDQLETSIDVLNQKIVLKRFEETSSTKLELEVFLWALSEIGPLEKELQIHTDSQNILSLLDRRQRLEANDFCNKGGDHLENHMLYRVFYQTIDSFDLKIQKIRGHSRRHEKSDIEKIFGLVDRSTRKALRDFKKSQNV